MDLHDSKNKKQGKLIIRCDNVKECSKFAILKLGAYKLMNTDGWFDKSDPFLRLLKIREDTTTQLVAETEVIKNNLNPSWNPFEVSLGRLCGGDPG